MSFIYNSKSLLQNIVAGILLFLIGPVDGSIDVLKLIKL